MLAQVGQAIHVVAGGGIEKFFFDPDRFFAPRSAGAKESGPGGSEFSDAVFAVGSFGLRRWRFGEADRENFLAIDHQHLVGIDGNMGSRKADPLRAQKQNGHPDKELPAVKEGWKQGRMFFDPRES